MSIERNMEEVNLMEEIGASTFEVCAFFLWRKSFIKNNINS